LKLLFLAAEPPCALEHNGASQNLLDIIKHLHGRHEISLLTFCSSREEATQAPALKPFCHHVDTVLLRLPGKHHWKLRFRTLLTGRPSFVTICESIEMKRKLVELTRREAFDVIQFQGIYMAPYVDAIPRPRVAATVLHEIELNVVRLYRDFKAAGSPAAKAYRLKDWLNMVSFEPAACGKFDRVIVCCGQDQHVLTAYDPTINTAVIPFGVDDALFDIESGTDDGTRLVFLGSYRHPPNVDGALFFANEILPMVREQLPAVTLSLVGGSPPESIRDLARHDGVEVTGYVEDLTAHLKSAAVCVAPVRYGAGQKTKVLTAMAAAKPVVSTRLGIESLDAVPGRDLLVADEPQEFAGQIVRLLRDPGLRRSIGEHGRRLAQHRYSWRKNVVLLEQIYQDIRARSARA